MQSTPYPPTAAPCFQRRIITLRESPGTEIEGVGLFERGEWPCSWIHAVERIESPSILYFRLRFSINQTSSFLVHMTADERYRFFLDGVEVAEGPERGDIRHWFFDTFEVGLEPGEHVFLAQVNALGHAAMRSQMSLRPGFFFCPETGPELELLGSGRESAPWEYYLESGYSFEEPFTNEAYSVGWNCIHDGRVIDMPPGHAEGKWKPVVKGLPGANPSYINRSPQRHLLHPATLPDPARKRLHGMRVLSVEELSTNSLPEILPYPEAPSDGEAAIEWERLLRDDVPLDLPEGECRLRILVDLRDYACADVVICLSGGEGSRLRIGFAESLFEDETFTTKGRRDRYWGKYFRGIGDTYIAGGGEGQFYKSIFWRSGRYVEILLEKCGRSLRIDSLLLINRGYPLEQACRLKTDLPGFNHLFDQAVRTIRASAHDSLMDGPYYEQMCWIGDNQQASVTHFVLFRDTRLIEKCLQTFDVSRTHTGLIRARWPARDWMIIVPFAFYWINTTYELALWRDTPNIVRSLLPGLRATVDAVLGMRNADGLIEVHEGWAFVDWVPEWPMGIPDGADGGVNACINWHFVHTLQRLSELEGTFGEPEFAQRYRRIALELSDRLCQILWVPEASRFADTPERLSFSEHGQVFAVLSGLLPEAIRASINLDPDETMKPATHSFSHFVMEAYREMGRPDLILKRLGTWRLFQDNGFLTLPEQPDPSRSDCHAWSAHPVYHYFASILGVRPSAFGFKRVEIKPMLNCPYDCSGTLPHPDGEIQVSMEGSGEHKTLSVSLPPKVPGELAIGENKLAIPSDGKLVANISLSDLACIS